MSGKNIFISYRRDTGVDIAARVKDFFTAKGYNVFYDISSMRLGEFDKQIFRQIGECDYFILILSENALDRCGDKNDWVRREIECALNIPNIQIIPLMLPKFEFPDDLPPELEKIKHYQGVQYNAILFDLVMNKLAELIDGKSEKNSTDNVKSEFSDLLNQLYSKAINVREALRRGDQAAINSSFPAFMNSVQNVYLFCEKTSYTNPELSQIAMEICNHYNAFSQYFNAFAGCADRMSSQAQQLAGKAEEEFGKMVDLTLKTISELKKQ